MPADNPQYPEIHETNLKAIADAAWLRTVAGADEMRKHSEELFAVSLGERQALFEQILSQQQALFATLVPVLARAANNGVSIDAQLFATNPMEVAEAATAAKIVQELSPEIAEAIEAVVLKVLAQMSDK